MTVLFFSREILDADDLGCWAHKLRVANDLGHIFLPLRS